MRTIVIVQAALALVFASTVTNKVAYAQTADTNKPTKAYVLSEITPHDREAYVRYLQNVLPIIEKYGGRVVIEPFQPKKVLEGRALEGNLAMIEFPSPEARDAFWNSPEYRPWKQAREASATSHIIHIN